jgi:hypothetical protein
MIENESKNKANETGSNWTTSKERRKEMQTWGRDRDEIEILEMSMCKAHGENEAWRGDKARTNRDERTGTAGSFVSILDNARLSATLEHGEGGV